MYNTITWQEVKILVQGLLPETPLGRLVSIRSESDIKTIKNFSPEQKQARLAWRRKLADEKKADNDTLEREFSALESMLQRAFG